MSRLVILSICSLYQTLCLHIICRPPETQLSRDTLMIIYQVAGAMTCLDMTIDISRQGIVSHHVLEILAAESPHELVLTRLRTTYDSDRW